MARLIIFSALFLSGSNVLMAQAPGSQLRSYAVPLNDFDLLSIGLVLLCVMAVHLVRKIRNAKNASVNETHD